ncbi:hypothetical protein [Sphingomonas sp.]|nr:hypothetical protein [Sphingomonas sp.]
MAVKLWDVRDEMVRCTIFRLKCRIAMLIVQCNKSRGIENHG